MSSKGALHQDMKAITFLGVRPTDTCYVFPDGREYVAPFFGIALAREWLISWTMAQLGLYDQLLERDVRKRVEDALGAEVQKQSKNTTAEEHAGEGIDLSKLPSYNDVVKLFGQLSELRNDLMHAGKRKNPLPANKVEEQARLLYEQAKEL